VQKPKDSVDAFPEAGGAGSKVELFGTRNHSKIIAEDLMSNPPVASPAGPVLLETIENGVALLVMNRPDKLNSLNNELATALNQTFEESARRCCAGRGADWSRKSFLRRRRFGGDRQRREAETANNWNRFCVWEWARCCA